jgi:3'-5' exoribonuclease
VAGYKKAPAAVQNHHAFIGGLLEHTLSVLELATRIFGINDDADSHYPQVSRDLVLAGIFLHDIGKTAELTADTNFAYTNAGQLVGHITQAAIWIDRKCADVEQSTGKPFPEEVQNMLTHIVLSHHGHYEFGSPRLPACPEAFVVHYLDNIDAKVSMCLTAMGEAKSADSDWSEWVKPLETRVFRKDVMGVRVETR